MQTMDDQLKQEVYSFPENLLKLKLAECISTNVSAETWQWLEEKASLIRRNENAQNFLVAFAATPRKTGKNPVLISEADVASLQQIRPHFTIQHWSIDRLCRVWLLLQLDHTYQHAYIRTIESLFPTAEMNELIALYSALPVLAYPESWRARCAEGIRSNIAGVLEAIMCNNPYPSENLDQPAWNQLVLKAIFTEKPINRIVGLDERSNQDLANTLSDYAHERWAAHRPVYPLLWRCVGKFMNEKIFQDIQRLAFSEQMIEREAAALACAQSSYAPARELVMENEMLRAVLSRGITWDDLAKKLDGNS